MSLGQEKETRSRSSSGLKRALLGAASIAASAALLGLMGLLLADRLEPDRILEVMGRTDRALASLCLLCVWLLLPLNTVRLAKVLEWVSNTRPSRWKLLRVTGVGSFVTVVAPLALLGDLARIAAMKPLAGVSLGLAARAIIYDKVAAAIFLALLGVLMVPLHLAMHVSTRTVALEAVILFGVLAAAAVLLGIARRAHSIRQPVIREVVVAVYGAVALLRGRSRVALQIAFAGANSGLFALFVWLLALAMGLQLGFWSILMFMPFILIVNNLPFLYLGWGGRELAMVATFGTFGTITVTDALALSVGIGMLLFLAMLPNGLFLLGRWRAPQGGKEAA